MTKRFVSDQYEAEDSPWNESLREASGKEVLARGSLMDKAAASCIRPAHSCLVRKFHEKVGRW